MDGVFASGSTTQKRLRGGDVELGKDVISNLPVDVLLNILSLLPTNDLVRTSVLSTSWRYVWKFFSVIDIDLDLVKDIHEWKTGFLDLVERKMLISSTARVRKFRLNLLEHSVSVSESDVMLLVDKVIEHKALELDLTLAKGTFYRLPNRLFSSNSLTTLKLLMDCDLIVPKSVCFPSLKVLNLARVKFP